MHRIRFVGRQPSLNLPRNSLRYQTRNTEQFSRVRGWNVKNGKVSELQMFITETIKVGPQCVHMWTFISFTFDND